MITLVLSTLGTVALLPINGYVFIIKISYEFAATPIITFLMILGTIYHLVRDLNNLWFVVLPNPSFYQDDNADFSKRKVCTFFGLFFIFIKIIMQKATINQQLAKLL